MKAGMRLFAAVFALVCAPVVYGQGAVPVGAEFQINSYTTSTQDSPSVAAAADGGFVVVWSSDPSNSIQGQRHGSDGTALGAEFQVNTQTDGSLLSSSVATLADGGFVVLWAGNSDIQGQRFAAQGTPEGEEFQVNSYTGGLQGAPAVAPLADGGFVATWDSAGSSGSDSSSFSIQSQRFAADGTLEGGEFQINSDTTGSQHRPAVATLTDGSFIVTWTSLQLDGSRSAHGRRFAAQGTPEGEEFQVNSYTVDVDYHGHQAVAPLPEGGFIVTWASFGSDASALSIQARRFAADGTPDGGEVQVNSYTFSSQSSPSVATFADGSFVVVWDSYGSNGSDSSYLSIQGQRYAVDGLALGGEFQINSYTTFSQSTPSVAPLPDGDFVVAWTSYGSSGSDTSRHSIQGQRFVAPRFSLVGLGGKCLDVDHGGTADGAPVSMFGCHGADNQRWQLELTSGPQRLVGSAGKCLIPGPVDDDGNIRTVTGDCAGPEALWQLDTPGSSSPSLLVHEQSGMCLGVLGGSTADFTPTILSDCHGTANQVWRPAPEVCTWDAHGLCLERERFRVDLEWHSFDGTTGSGKAVPVGSDDSGLLWFFEADNWELLIKVLDGCAINDRLWVFAAATTTVEYTLRVTDTQVGIIREYHNDLGNAAASITDTDAFDTCPAGSTSQTAIEEPAAGRVADKPMRALRTGKLSKGTCVQSATRMCLADGRFSVEVTWRDHNGNIGFGQMVDVGSPDSGLLWFFNSSNWEMLVKVLDACHLEDARFLMLAAATTDVEHTLRVTDTESGFFREYFNPQGNAAAALVDSFATCP